MASEKQPLVKMGEAIVAIFFFGVMAFLAVTMLTVTGRWAVWLWRHCIP